jgi:hypothetical protein
MIFLAKFLRGGQQQKPGGETLMDERSKCRPTSVQQIAPNDKKYPR